MLKIGNLEFKYGLMLAPMAGFTDRAMRLVCHRLGAEYSVSEMVSARAVVFKDHKTALIGRIKEDEGAVALQLFGKDEDVIARAAEQVQFGLGGVGYCRPAAIDLNMGCPVKKIFDNGEGSALMRDPDKIFRIVRSVKGSCDLPVTVKLRRGINEKSANAVECALAAEAGGADMVCIHGRTRAQMYSGFSDRETVKSVKAALRIPVVANGDVCSSADALSLLSETGADGIAVGRGAIGNPFIFSELLAVFSGKEYTAPTLDERIAIAKEQLLIAIEDKGEGVAIRESRKQIAMYFRSFRGAAALRGEINRALYFGEVEQILERLRLENAE